MPCTLKMVKPEQQFQIQSSFWKYIQDNGEKRCLVTKGKFAQNKALKNIDNPVTSGLTELLTLLGQESNWVGLQFHAVCADNARRKALCGTNLYTKYFCHTDTTPRTYQCGHQTSPQSQLSTKQLLRGGFMIGAPCTHTLGCISETEGSKAAWLVVYCTLTLHSPGLELQLGRPGFSTENANTLFFCFFLFKRVTAKLNCPYCKRFCITYGVM